MNFSNASITDAKLDNFCAISFTVTKIMRSACVCISNLPAETECSNQWLRIFITWPFSHTGNHHAYKTDCRKVYNVSS